MVSMLTNILRGDGEPGADPAVWRSELHAPPMYATKTSAQSV